MYEKEIVYVLSDSVGDTAELLVKTVAAQFIGTEFNIKTISYIENKEEINDLIALAKLSNAIIAYALFTPLFKKHLDDKANEEDVMVIDLIGPLLETFATKLNKQPVQKPSIIEGPDNSYFRRIEAIEFAVQYDDGKDMRGIKEADIVLIGVSRTLKTPLSMYLAHKMVKVANIPLVPEVSPPEELFKLSEGKCIGLTMSPEKLREIRVERLKHLGLSPDSSYAKIERIKEELQYAEKIMDNIGCPIMDFSTMAIEEAAEWIISSMPHQVEIISS